MQDAEYKITASDLLEVEVFGVSELKRTVRVMTAPAATIALRPISRPGSITAPAPIEAPS